MAKKTLVLGASLKNNRYSNIIIKKLLEKGHPVIATGQAAGHIDGVKVVIDRPKFEDIDTITLYLSPKHQTAFYDYIVSLQPRRVIFNPGTENKEFMMLLAANNIEAEVACSLVLLATDQY